MKSFNWQLAGSITGLSMLLTVICFACIYLFYNMLSIVVNLQLAGINH